ncbi:hypothetical protein BO78DRAFT_177002 [Aspergillus sclerotiicarbonarius CBS 121057]|uniref:Uncharacterized protein n=1 Tax=Aspergillus sclerotiicarbonarius (strain CBS 121057 / IBT 28362) TaxID=1448318 RepID=A0A319E245_ASPSB|nr:hypothetical protein BO78DRAFT_177002 [Aspergillus sclerotiicarbonarius CBS 121057]
MATATIRSWSCLFFFFLFLFFFFSFPSLFCAWRFMGILPQQMKNSGSNVGGIAYEPERFIWLRSTSHPGFGLRFTTALSPPAARHVHGSSFPLILPFYSRPVPWSTLHPSHTVSFNLVLFCKRENWAASHCTLSHSVIVNPSFPVLQAPILCRRVVRVQLSGIGPAEEDSHHYRSALAGQINAIPFLQGFSNIRALVVDVP